MAEDGSFFPVAHERVLSCTERQEELAASNGSSQTVGTAEPAFVFHQANAYEEGQQVVVDCVRYPEMPDFKQVTSCHGCQCRLACLQDPGSCMGPEQMHLGLHKVFQCDDVKLQVSVCVCFRGSVISVICLQASSSGRSFVDCVDPDKQPISQLWRYAVDTKTGHVKERMLSARAMEFPAINPAYTGSTASTTLTHTMWQTLLLQARCSYCTVQAFVCAVSSITVTANYKADLFTQYGTCIVKG